MRLRLRVVQPEDRRDWEGPYVMVAKCTDAGTPLKQQTAILEVNFGGNNWEWEPVEVVRE